MSEARDKAREVFMKDQDVGQVLLEEGFNAGWDARKRASFERIYGDGSSELRCKVMEFFERNRGDGDNDAGNKKAIGEFIEQLLKREVELNTPEPPKTSMDWYFHPRGASREMRESLKKVIWPLLLHWAAYIEYDPEDAVRGGDR